MRRRPRAERLPPHRIKLRRSMLAPSSRAADSTPAALHAPRLATPKAHRRLRWRLVARKGPLRGTKRRP